jgi:hypothetical protein
MASYGEQLEGRSAGSPSGALVKASMKVVRSGRYRSVSVYGITNGEQPHAVNTAFVMMPHELTKID